MDRQTQLTRFLQSQAAAYVMQQPSVFAGFTRFDPAPAPIRHLPSSVDLGRQWRNDPSFADLRRAGVWLKSPEGERVTTAALYVLSITDPELYGLLVAALAI